ncbi:peptide/nickel transport system substrate-binding protein [Antricoccus suffuscus]|uniref:Peptide/nickel transport system substrate-binding protein n=1 Tax=Antricoccus suffuscus TaxID=1629062 RepID=A0A2T1A6K8_9ACTN|nr:ABC transporter substrate-binding protein [Antricoccus suffuscus]PRZ44231.1 peptide/nickel transport system substrate-binding protein [Antricoccus suffuscus]
MAHTLRGVPRRKLAPVIAMAASALTALSVVSCSSGASGSTDTAANKDATLKVVQGATPNQFDPCGTANGSETTSMNLIYAPLIRGNPATGELSPGLATSWKFSDDSLSLTLTLQEGLTFQDGTPLNASTVAESLNQCLALGSQTVDEIESVKAEGTKTLVFHLNAPNAGLPEILSSRLGLIASPAAREKEGTAFGSKPVGAGPFTLETFTPGSTISLKRWTGYKEAGVPAPKVAAIEISIITDPSAQVAALSGGQADFAFSLNSTAAKTLKDTPGVTFDSYLGVSVADLNIDRSHGPLADVRVRQAISYAIDRKALAEVGTDGLSDVGSVQPYPPGHPYYDKGLASTYDYNPKKAKQLLADAGYPNGLKLNGVGLDGAIYVNNGIVIADQLAKVGIDVTFEAKALPEATKSFYTDHKYDLMSTGMNSGPDWYSIYRRLLTTSSAGNAGHVPLDGGNEAVAALGASKDQDELNANIKAANKVYQAELPIIPLFYNPISVAWTDKVDNAKSALAINGQPDLAALSIKQ